MRNVDRLIEQMQGSTFTPEDASKLKDAIERRTTGRTPNDGHKHEPLAFHVSLTGQRLCTYCRAPITPAGTPATWKLSK